MRTIAVIPCYNEAKYIGELVKHTRKYVHDVLVVDDFSTDDTGQKAIEAGAKAVVCPMVGAGAATSIGLWAALNMMAEGDSFITLDGDGQHNPDDIPAILEPLRDHRADLVIGNRFNESLRMPAYRQIGNKVINFCYNMGASCQLKDTQSGFRGFTADTLRMLLPFNEPGFGFSTETLIKARKQGLRILEVPIHAVYHSDLKDNSTHNPVRHGIEVALCTIKWRMKVGK